MKTKLTCIITDDEPYARKGLAGYAERTGLLELQGICEDGLQLKEMLLIHRPDLLFLDIEMPHLSGIDLLRSLPYPPKVIFTTAYEQYAIESYELDVLDYLLKPISYERFLKATLKAKEYYSFTESPAINTALFIKSGGRLEKLVFDELLYAEGMENYLVLHLATKKLIIHSTLKAFLEKLPAADFMQIHKSFIVALNKVQSIEGNTLLVMEKSLPVGRNLLRDVTDRIMNRYR